MTSLELIKKFLHERLEEVPEDISNETVLVDLGVDSLMLAELMFEAEDTLGIQIASDVTPPKTIGEMVHLLEELVAQKKA